MKHTIANKLKSNRGASMILAMALFLVCTMVSSVIIATASSGLSRNAQREEQQNAYLAISSASDYLMEELRTGGKYVGSSTVKEYGCKDCSIAATMEYFGAEVSGYRLDANYIPNPLDDGHLLIPKEHNDDIVNKKTEETSCTLEGSMGDMLKRAAGNVYVSGTAYSEQIVIELEEADARLPKVLCDFSMNTDYDIVFLVYTENRDYAITIEASGIVYEREPVVVQDDTDDHTVYFKWFNEETGAFEDKSEQLVIPAKIVTTITEVTWEIPSIEKGGLSQ